ncbi:hypothetical protein [Anaerovibrio lipolyticus]|uniref:hypothetical protein n=1 Tax=Anaerovibrio lipolyticus TaxID=82374 RepID=UPI0026EC5142|nr:hypothetical protein [Anaerovibrio lipolyticus]MBE6106021.1 hypothetical protein [Anaerovibrio lipolyticus]
MSKVIDQFYIEEIDASWITLDECIPATSFTKLKIGEEERDLVPFHLNTSSWEKWLTNIAVKGGGDLVGKEVVFI